MGIEVPVFKRCCFCLPLRYGLIGWGYIKLLITTYVSYTFVFDIWRYIKQSNDLRYGPPPKASTMELIMLSIVGCILIIDYIITITFIVGCHQKRPKLIRIFYYYSQVILFLIVLLNSFIIYLAYDRITRFELNQRMAWVQGILDVCMGFINIGVEIYLLLLVRSQIIKLDNVSQFRFENHTTSEPVCTMNVKDPVRKDDYC